MILKVELWHDKRTNITILPQFNVPSNKLDKKKGNQKVVHKKKKIKTFKHLCFSSAFTLSVITSGKEHANSVQKIN